MDMESYAKELREAGWNEAQVDRELKYIERVAWENEKIRSERGWNYGFTGPED